MIRALLLSFVLLGFASLSHGQGIAVPTAATVLTSGNELLTVRGVQGALLPGQPLLYPAGEAVIAAAFLHSGGVYQTASQISGTDLTGAVGFTMNARNEPALFGFFADETLAWVCFPGAHILTNRAGQTTDTTSWGDRVVALGPVQSSSLVALVSVGNSLWAETIALPEGVVNSSVPVDGQTPCVSFEGGWLCSAQNGLVWAPAAHPEQKRELPLPVAVTSLQTANSHAVSINGHWLLNSAWKLLEIPTVVKHRPNTTLRPPRGFDR